MRYAKKQTDDDDERFGSTGPSHLPAKNDGPPRHTASDKGLDLKQADEAKERAKWLVREESVRTTVPVERRRRRPGSVVRTRFLLRRNAGPGEDDGDHDGDGADGEDGIYVQEERERSAKARKSK